jgi:hypothetical protein
MKSSAPPKLLFLSFIALTVPALLLSQNIPLTNWTVPPYHRAVASGGLVTMGDVTPGIGFVGVNPCRLVDTRQAGFPAGYGQPALAAGVPRNFDLNSQPNCPGIPAGVGAYSLNFTVTNTQGPGFIKIYPQGGSVPLDVSTLNYVGGQTIANAAIVPAGGNGGVTVVAGVSGTDLIIDINGYFTDSYNNGIQFFAAVTVPGAAILGKNYSNGSFAYGVEGDIATTGAAPASAGVRGFNSGTGAGGVGVWGSQEGSGWGVAGDTPGGVGVHGDATNGTGVTYGVLGRSRSTSNDAAGVEGVTDPLIGPVVSYSPAGVRGQGVLNGVLGVAGNFFGGGEGVAGSLLNGAGTEVVYGSLASNFGTDVVGPPWGVFSGGNIGASGAKYFLDPHPTDATKEIAYVSLEGPEAGTYFRGRAKFQNGMARIPVPEHFRFVTDPEGLTVQITPIGAMASFAVLKMDLNEIVVESSRNVEFSYLVQGVRATFKDVSPIRSSGDFMPRSANAKIPEWLSPAQKRLLIQNGTYREDGTVNTETARQVGWDRVWEQRAQPASQPAPQAVTP